MLMMWCACIILTAVQRGLCVHQFRRRKLFIRSVYFQTVHQSLTAGSHITLLMFVASFDEQRELANGS